VPRQQARQLVDQAQQALEDLAREWLGAAALAAPRAHHFSLAGARTGEPAVAHLVSASAGVGYGTQDIQHGPPALALKLCTVRCMVHVLCADAHALLPLSTDVCAGAVNHLPATATAATAGPAAAGPAPAAKEEAATGRKSSGSMPRFDEMSYEALFHVMNDWANPRQARAARQELGLKCLGPVKASSTPHALPDTDRRHINCHVLPCLLCATIIRCVRPCLNPLSAAHAWASAVL